MTKRTPPTKGEKGYTRLAFDNYRTPAWVTDALLDQIIHKVNELGGRVWEPASGEGDMVNALRARNLTVWTSDIRSVGSDYDGLDFTAPFGDAWLDRCPFPSTVITNPPYAHAEQFIKRALAYTEPLRGIVAMLLLHEFDAPAYHRPLMQHPAFAMKVMLPKRIRWVGMETRADGKKVGPRQVHAWYVWAWGKLPDRAPAMVWA